jgi:hypothetical protein
MDNNWTILISAAAGAALGFLPQYFIEGKKAKNERMKYAVEVRIAVGERFYEMSGLSLKVFEAILRTFENIKDFYSEEAKSVYVSVQNQYQSYAQAIASTTNTITAADIYFKIDGIDEVNRWMAEYQQKLAELNEIAANGNYSDGEIIGNEIKDLLRKVISALKRDRATISKEINHLLS